MNRIFGAVMLAVASFGSTSIAFADTTATAQPVAKVSLQEQSQIAQLQSQVGTLTSEVAALQMQAESQASSSDIINNLSTGG